MWVQVPFVQCSGPFQRSGTLVICFKIIKEMENGLITVSLKHLYLHIMLVRLKKVTITLSVILRDVNLP